MTVKDKERRIELSKEKEVIARPFVRKPSIYVSILSPTSPPYLIIITPYLPPLPFFFFNWKPFPSPSPSSLISSPLDRLLLYPLLPAFIPLSPLHFSPPSLLLSACPFPQAKAPSHLFHSCLLSVIHSPSSTSSSSLPHHSLSPFLPRSPVDETRRVYHTLISADTCSIPPLLLLSLSSLFPLSALTHTHMHRRG